MDGLYRSGTGHQPCRTEDTDAGLDRDHKLIGQHPLGISNPNPLHTQEEEGKWFTGEREKGRETEQRGRKSALDDWGVLEAGQSQGEEGRQPQAAYALCAVPARSGLAHSLG